MPKQIAALKGQRVVQVAAGKWHSLFLTEAGDVFSCGHGGAKLGHGDWKGGHGDTNDALAPKQIAALKGQRVVQVAAGGRHSLFLTDAGSVFSCWGAIGSGELGHGKDDWEVRLVDGEPTDVPIRNTLQRAPKRIVALEGKGVTQVSAGNNHSLFLTDAGSVLFCGMGPDGCSDTRPRGAETFEPTLLAGLEGRHVVQISAGDAHSLLLLREGTALSFGCGYSGVLGHGDTKNVLAPKPIARLGGRRVVQVAASEHHSLFQTDDGVVFSCGKDSDGDGLLGHGRTKKSSVPKQICFPRTTPTSNATGPSTPPSPSMADGVQRQRLAIRSAIDSLSSRQLAKHLDNYGISLSTTDGTKKTGEALRSELAGRALAGNLRPAIASLDSRQLAKRLQEYGVSLSAADGTKKTREALENELLDAVLSFSHTGSGRLNQTGGYWERMRSARSRNMPYFDYGRNRYVKRRHGNLTYYKRL